MIIELYGPPGSGKTTFARALVRRLRDQGYNVRVMLSYQPGQDRLGWDPLGIVHFILRIAAAIWSIARIAVTSGTRQDDMALSTHLVGLLKPKSIVWRVRLWQYIVHLSHCRNDARKSADIVIFDQGFVQAVGWLAMFSDARRPEVLAKALRRAPLADLLIRVEAPIELVEQRLLGRMNRELPAERLFEADVAVNLGAFDIFDEIGGILAKTDVEAISVQPVNQRSTVAGLDTVERAVMVRRSAAASGPVAVQLVNTLPGDGDRLACESSGRVNGHDHAIRKDAEVSAAAQAPAVQAGVAKAEFATSNSTTSSDIGRRLSYASVFALMVYIFGAGLTSLAQILIARLIGSTSYGIYAYALAWSTMLAYLSTLGFNFSLLRYVPAYSAKGEFNLAKGVIIFALKRAAIAAILAAGFGAVVVLYTISTDEPELRIALLLAMATVPLVTAYALGATLVRAFGGVVSALLPERVGRDGLLIVLVVAAGLWGATMDASLVMKAVLASSVATACLVLFSVVMRWPAQLRNVSAARDERLWWAAVAPITLIIGLEVFVSRTGVLVLGWIGHIQDAGIFALSLNVAMLVGLSRIAVSVMFAPSAATLHANGKNEEMQRLFSRAALLCFVGAAAVGIPLLVIAKPLLSWFGPDFAAGAPIARILIVGYVLAALGGPQQNLLMMTGNEWIAANSMIIAVVANIVACSIGVLLQGPVGAAIGVSVALVVWNVAMAVYIYRRLGIVPGLFHAVRNIGFRQGSAASAG